MTPILPSRLSVSQCVNRCRRDPLLWLRELWYTLHFMRTKTPNNSGRPLKVVTSFRHSVPHCSIWVFFFRLVNVFSHDRFPGFQGFKDGRIRMFHKWTSSRTPFTLFDHISSVFTVYRVLILDPWDPKAESGHGKDRLYNRKPLNYWRRRKYPTRLELTLVNQSHYINLVWFLRTVNVFIRICVSLRSQRLQDTFTFFQSKTYNKPMIVQDFMIYVTDFSDYYNFM